MKSRTINNRTEFDKAVSDLSKYQEYPYVMTVTAGSKIRTDGQNKRHWSSIEQLMYEIDNAVNLISEHTGYTPLETKRVVAESMPPEHVGILYARTSVVVHEILKAIVNIPTSTRLGSKEFSRFDDVMETTIADIISEINTVVRQSI